MKVWGDTPEAVRSLSAVAGTLTIPAIYLLGKRLGDRRVGLAAALILALAPFHVRFAQETRMYAVLTLCAVLAMVFLVRLLTDERAATQTIGSQLGRFIENWRRARQAQDKVASQDKAGYQQDFRGDLDWVKAPTQGRWLPLREVETDLSWIGYILFTTATTFGHNTAVLFPLAVNLFVFSLIFFRRLLPARLSPAGADSPPRRPNDYGALQPPSLKNWLIAQIGVFLLWSPWLAAYIVQASGVYAEFWIPAPTKKTVIDTIKTFLCAFLPERSQWSFIVWSLFGLTALMGVVFLRKRLAHFFLLLALFVTPFAGELLVSLRRPIFYDRTLIWASIPLYLLLAAGIAQLRYRPYILTAVVILGVINALALRDYYRYFQKEEWNKAAALVAKEVQTDDLILFNATWVQIPFDYYFRSYNRPVAEHGVPVDLFDRGILEPKMAESDLPRLRSLIRGRERVWLVYSHNWYTDPHNLIPPALAEELKLLKTYDFIGLQVRLYGIP